MHRSSLEISATNYQNRNWKSYFCTRSSKIMDKLDFTKRSFIALAFCLSICIPSFGQQTASPFDLLPRLPQTDSQDSTITISTSSNPFDILNIYPSEGSSTNFTPQFQIKRPRSILSSKEKKELYQQFLFFTIVTMLVMLTLTMTIFRIFIGKLWQAFLNDNLLSQLLREQSAGVRVGNLILYTMFLINASIFTFIALKYFNIKIAESNFGTLMLCISGISAFYATKHLMLSSVRYIFPIEKEVGRYNFTIIVFNIIAGIFLVPLILFAAYAPENVRVGFIYLTIGLLVALLAFRGLRGLLIANRFFAWHKFHFFLYLCAVEIAPLLVIIKLLEVY